MEAEQQQHEAMSEERLASAKCGWDMLMDELTIFYQKNGHVTVTADDNNNDDDAVLVVWSAQQKQYHEALFNGSQAMPLDAERLLKLDSLGFFCTWWNNSNPAWNPQWPELSWDLMHKALLFFHDNKKNEKTIQQGPSGEFSLLKMWSEHYKAHFSKILSGQVSTSTQDAARMAKLASINSFDSTKQVPLPITPDSNNTQERLQPASDHNGSTDGLQRSQAKPPRRLSAETQSVPHEISIQKSFSEDSLSCTDDGSSKIQTSVARMPKASFDWILDHNNRLNDLCRGFEMNEGCCIRGTRCRFTHVFSEHRAHRIPALPEFCEDNVTFLHRRDRTRTAWYTSAHTHNNVVVLVFGGKGVKSGDVYWYRTKKQAVDALKAVVSDSERRNTSWREKKTHVNHERPNSHGKKSTRRLSQVDQRTCSSSATDNKKRNTETVGKPERKEKRLKTSLDSPLSSGRANKGSLVQMNAIAVVSSQQVDPGDTGERTEFLSSSPKKKRNSLVVNHTSDHSEYQPKTAIDSPLSSSRTKKDTTAKAKPVVIVVPPQKLVEPLPEFPMISRDWLTECRKDPWEECRFYKKNQCTKRGCCEFAHVRRDGKFLPGAKVDEWKLKLTHRRDSDGVLHFTSGMVRGNKFIYAVGGRGGRECPESGIWFYPSGGQAREALLDLFD